MYHSSFQEKIAQHFMATFNACLLQGGHWNKNICGSDQVCLFVCVLVCQLLLDYFQISLVSATCVLTSFFISLGDFVSHPQ